tara:strand:+ start:595 stop:885 length:291 start_codon:yes stop_codon:yes gene_type:complete
MKTLNTFSILFWLKQANVQKGKFQPSFLQFEGYLDLFLTIESLIKVCIMASHMDEDTAGEDHGLDIRKTLEVASQLLPFEEGEFLDEAYELLIQKS